ncbi:MAG: DEAD/DEAH box helicase [Proteobacteria bacterium]|nr:DEAD/DEAH box helicase [Pseudomonadota bacterium]
MKVSLPDDLRPYRREAERALNQGAVKDIEFSGSTYQVLVEDPSSREDFWVFLQLEGKGEIKDAFCSGEHVSEAPGCVHLAIAYLSLFKEFSQPLHQRFARSLWNQLCRLYEERLGDDPKLLIKAPPGSYICRSGLGKKIFTLQALTPEAIHVLDKMIHKRTEETEETSLKFSNLSYEDLSSWREGKPNPQLRYDLSFWSDLAKWLMKKQEEEMPYQISFKYSKKKLPNWFQIDFEDIQVGFYVSEANLSLIIESLKTVKSPLSVYQAARKGIERIIYDKKNQTLHIEEKKEEKTPRIGRKIAKGAEAIPLDHWIFIPGEGFYTDEPHELLKTPDLHGEDMIDVLTEHRRLIASLIVDCHVHREAMTLSYQLHFDHEWNLHITAYLFEPGDLTTGDSWLMGDWVYLDEDGFYPIEGNRFQEAEIMISMYQVSDFVSQNRAWFNTQEGFRTHLRSIEYQMSYQVSESQRLTFSRSLAKVKEEIRQQDFGTWVYLESYGFYSKATGSFSFLLRPGVSLSPEQIPLFIRMNREELQLIPKFFSEHCPVTKAGFRIELTDKRKVNIMPEYELLPEYQGKTIQLFDDFVYLEGEGFHELPLDLRLPEKFRHSLELEGEDLLLFLTYEIDELYSYASFIDPRLVKPKEWRLVANLIQSVPERGRGWYHFRFFYQTEHGLISIIDLRQALAKKFPFAFFEAGLIDMRDKRFDWLRQLPKERFDKETDLLLLTTLEFMRLNAFESIEMLKVGDEKELHSSAAILDDLIQLHTPEQPDMGGLLSHLRPYQEIGAQWLWFLYRQQLSGLLCDDMGLGKTHQAMALLASIANLYRSYAEGIQHHFLIVCPTSVIYHWQEKLQQFLPGLRVCTFYGTNRSLEAFHQQYDILLTSYGILRNERELLAKVPFEVAIFDEIQIAKNQFSRVYAALVQIKAQMKIGLTGTPIENHLRELKSLFDITLPSYMPGENEYREFFIKPIEREHDKKRKEILSRLIRPFVLRRKKEDVLKELPEKIEEIAYCDLMPYQQKLYSEVLERRRHHLLEELRNDKTAIPYLHIFALLSGLKQICDHPAVYLKTPLDYQEYSSGKWELFVELLREARESQQKVVIFSQYLGMLDIIEDYLREQQIGFAALRGATQNRKEQLQRFNQDPACEVFVGSLQAAGLGIDLTAGSVVIHYDRWWNAARENQATDRVHRIGQTRGVQVFKLVTKGTFEERIDAMIARKGKLMEEVVGVDEQHVLKTFSRNELMELLELVDTNQEHPAAFDDVD